MRRVIGVLGVIIMAGCATGRSTPPTFPEVPAAYAFEGLKRGAKVSVMDQRSEGGGDGTADELRRGVESVLLRSGVILSPGAPLLIEVRLTQYRSDFSMGNWRGCTSMVAAVRGLGDEPLRIPVERCVTRANTGGYGSANAASQASFNDAVSALLSELDLL